MQAAKLCAHQPIRWPCCLASFTSAVARLASISAGPLLSAGRLASACAPLRRDRVFWTVKWEIRVDLSDPERVESHRAGEWLQHQRGIRLAALWVHGRTADQLACGANVQFCWDPLLEAHPTRPPPEATDGTAASGASAAMCADGGAQPALTLALRPKARPRRPALPGEPGRADLVAHVAAAMRQTNTVEGIAALENVLKTGLWDESSLGPEPLAPTEPLPTGEATGQGAVAPVGGRGRRRKGRRWNRRSRRAHGASAAGEGQEQPEGGGNAPPRRIPPPAAASAASARAVRGRQLGTVAVAAIEGRASKSPSAAEPTYLCFALLHHALHPPWRSWLFAGGGSLLCCITSFDCFNRHFFCVAGSGRYCAQRRLLQFMLPCFRHV